MMKSSKPSGPSGEGQTPGSKRRRGEQITPLSMNRLFGVPASAGPGRLKAGLRTYGTTQAVHAPNARSQGRGGFP